MTEENTSTPTTIEATPAVTPEIDNNAIKNSPLFQKLASKLAERERADNERVEAENKLKAEEAQKKLIEEGRFEESLKSKEQEIEKIRLQHAQELTSRDIRGELYKAGFQNDNFVNGAVLGYNAETGSVADYVAAIAADESNAMFAANVTKPAIPAPASGSVANVSGVQITKDNYRTMLKSPDPAISKQARTWGAANADQVYDF